MTTAAVLDRLRQFFPLGFFLALLVYAVWPWLPLPGRPAPQRTLVVYGFSILEGVMTEGIFPAFEEDWHARTGQDVEVIGAFAGSGVVTSQIVMGVPAQVAVLALELDALRLVEAGRVLPDSWRSLPHSGVVNRTPFVLLVREGNPLNIRDFADLTRPGVAVVHPDPLTSGGAMWGVVAEYGAGLRSGGPERGYEVLLGVWRNVVARASSARAARTQFEQGFGDALVIYEQDALRDVAGSGSEVVVPHSTVLSEHTVVLVETNITEADRPIVDAFVDFLWSDEAQRIFVEHGFRSVNEELNALNPNFGHIADPFTIEDLGGWEYARDEIVDRVWRDRVLVELEQ